MAVFGSKSVVSSEKLRGGYYTPDAIARYLASWVAAAGLKRLEPSCGDGAVLVHLAQPGAEAVAVELQSSEATVAAKRSGVDVIVGDFFEWLQPPVYGSFDGVAGNPPYIRFGNWDEELRSGAISLMKREGLKPNKLTNAWVPFVVGALLAVRPGGRVGLVLPAELLQVSYASQLRAYLVDRCSSITIVSFEQLIFPGILQEVVLLLAERGDGPAAIRTAELKDAASLEDFDTVAGPSSRGLLHNSEKWTKYYLDPFAIEAVREMRSGGRLLPLRNFAEVDVGVVSGRNSFFVLSEQDAYERGIYGSTVPIISRSIQVPGLQLDDADLAALNALGSRNRLLLPDLNPVNWPQSLTRYVESGVEEGVHTGYKCRIRKQWWKVPSAWRPDAFMLRQISTHPRIVVNETDATSTDTVHRVRVRPGVDPSGLALSAFNSVSFALAEVVGRSYGGGILELEPSEAEELPIVDPSFVDLSLLNKVDELVKQGRLLEALDLTDQAVLLDCVGLSRTEVAHFRRIWQRLRDRRSRRGRRSAEA